MSTGFAVTPAELDRIGGRLDQVHHDLAEVVAYGDYRDALGHMVLADTMGSFEGNWSLRRHELSGDVGRLADLARGAAESYRQTDDEVGGSFGTEPPAAPPAPPVTGQPDYVN